VPVEAGQWVRAGQVLAVIDRSVQAQQAASAAAQIEVARADASLAQANLDRALQLVERGFVSKADVDRLTATRDAANARVAWPRRSWRTAGAQPSSISSLRLPAYVLERNVEPGQVVGGDRARCSRSPAAARWSCWRRSAKNELDLSSRSAPPAR
jgi:HlyD family secretion protein